MSPFLEEKVATLVRLIASGEFRAGETHRQLAEQWKCGIPHVSNLVAEAVRHIRLTQGDIDEMVTRKLAGLEDVRGRALANTKAHVSMSGEVVEVPAPDFRAAIEADRLYLQAIGALVTKRDGRAKDQPAGASEAYRKMTTEQRIALHEKALAEEKARQEERH